ncbi:MAG TPA: four helix bundle protein [Thermomicrobiales bacterium]|nr:four helix bundle protein [Thermomicrobiales bacterium]
MARGDELRGRTKAYALRVIALVGALPRGATADVLGRQLLRAATSVGANYRAACRAHSPEDFVAKLKIVEEEADECLYWLELLVESDLAPRERVADLLAEGNEILAITVASIKTVRSQKR